MSEINAIATNNFILHNIDAKKLYVQEPLFTANSGDAVYVGWRPDETVLCSGNSDKTATLSENVSGFEYLKVSVFNAGVDSNVISEVTFPSNKKGTFYYEAGKLSNQIHTYGGTIVPNGTSISIENGFHQWFTPTTGVGTEFVDSKIATVIGINRKENV